jgi:tetratricopeptide (TPR) repeat protein
MPYLLEAVRLKPSDPGNNLQLAICEQEMGNAPAAIEYYKAVVAAPNSLAEEKRIAFQNMARAYTSLGNPDTARQYARQADAIPAEPVQQP